MDYNEAKGRYIYMTHFYIIRHGETVFNRKGRIQGWCDSPLTDLGVSR